MQIDVIIPSYNVPDYQLFRCLASIACQNIYDKIHVTVVDDASTKENYQSVISHFRSHLDITLLRYEENGGPGKARQYGLEHTHLPYVTFIDADDTFNGFFALYSLLEGIETPVNENEQIVVSIGVFDEIYRNSDSDIIQSVSHVKDHTWMFGKLYRLRILE